MASQILSDAFYLSGWIKVIGNLQGNPDNVRTPERKDGGRETKKAQVTRQISFFTSHLEH